MADTYLLAMRCPVYRRRESHLGFRTELENLVGDGKGKGASVSSRQGWKSSGVKVPVPSIACIQTVSMSGACGGNKARYARM